MERLNSFIKAREASYLTSGSHSSFIDLVTDDTRRGLIRSASYTEHGLGSDTSISGNVLRTSVHTEQEALSQTKLLLEEAMTNPKIPEDIAKRAEDIYENLSFVGDKELREATHAIAEYWKTYLSDNPDMLLFIITSKTFETEGVEVEDETQDVSIGYISDNKSDNYILDNVLSNFSNEELREYGSRLLFSAAEYNERDSHKIKTVILDDWIMSGQQMRDTLDGTFEQITPRNLEINLVISSKDRLTNGFEHARSVDPVAIKAYFTSRAASHPYTEEFGGAYLTAAHSSGDYPFEGTMQEIVSAINRTRLQGQKKFYMPPLTNIIRPYYSPDYHPRNIARLNQLRAIGGKALLNT